ncbi:Short-chain dehydrogenase TIC 32 A, chloroplastic [Paramyrothecium foliicola]|nr:Short-chain dehydrogenase TIC 32 A, chloroplastic [Paramyrothecium foliicola]
MAYTRSAIITGGTINLGYHAALDIARQHPDWLVIICSRSDKENAAEKINRTLNQKNVTFMPLDLSDSKKVRSFAREWSSKSYPPIQALLLNAALQFPDKIVYTDEGIEATFAIAHVGHALLFHLLFPHLAEKARVVVTASGVHDPALSTGMPKAIFTTAEALAHPPAEIANGNGQRHYCNSKLANIMWTYALQKRLDERVPQRRITVNAFDPGLMPGSGLAREYPPAFRFAWQKIMPRVTPLLRILFTPNIHKPSESGESLARLAASDEMASVAGKYFEGRKEIKSSVDSYDVKKQDDLWQWTINYCADDEASAARLEAF